MKTTIESYCGSSCSGCVERERSRCGGCVATEGSPFHGTCEIAECAKGKKKRFCGECEHLPCEKLRGRSRDGADQAARADRCRALKATLVQEAREGVNPVSCCGHHCDFCLYGPSCGGCRSDYNRCSFATLFEDGKCPNVKCATDKGLAGCYACSALPGCAIGYYGRPNEYVAKATALFIRDHGEDCYTRTLRDAISDGIHYPRTFDATGSVDGALRILERYRSRQEVEG